MSTALAFKELEDHIRADERFWILTAHGLTDIPMDPSRADAINLLSAKNSQTQSTSIFTQLHNYDNPKLGDNLRGEYGEALAQLFFIQHGFRVAKSGGDWYPYDLLVERHSHTLRVQVKTATGSTRYRRVWFSLSDDFDAAFIVTDDGTVYLIPIDEMYFEQPRKDDRNGRRFVLYPKYDQFKVGQFQSFVAPVSTQDSIKKIEGFFGL